MKQVQKCWCVMRSSFAKIHLVDRFLIVFMGILLLESTYSLFAVRSGAVGLDSIDVIFRTSTAAIFGYFLSTNFVRNATVADKRSAKGASVTEQESTKAVQNSISFSDSGTQTEEDAASANVTETAERDDSAASNLQITIAACIGLFCLVVIIVLRNLAGLYVDREASATASATITQFRDIVSGCVGFLIGCPTTAVTKK